MFIMLIVLAAVAGELLLAVAIGKLFAGRTDHTAVVGHDSAPIAPALSLPSLNLPPLTVPA